MAAAPHIELFLDLDNTCIHSVEPDSLRRLQAARVPIVADGHFAVGWDPAAKGAMYTTFVRPGLVDFLRRLDPGTCRLHVWTAGTKDYAEEIVAKLFTARSIPIAQIFHREHCEWSEAVHGHPKRLQTVREWHPFPLSTGAAARPLGPVAVLLDDLAEMAAGQENHVVTVPPFEAESSAADTFFRHPERVWEAILHRARAQTAPATPRASRR